MTKKKLIEKMAKDARRILIGVVFLILTTSYAFASPDFSGTWVLDSASGMGEVKGKVTIVIKQTNSTLSIDRNTGRGVETAIHKLDGSESINKLPSGKEKKSKSTWVGSTLVIKSTTDNIPSTEIFSLSPDGKVLTIDSTIQAPSKEIKRKLTYKKQ